MNMGHSHTHSISQSNLVINPKILEMELMPAYIYAIYQIGSQVSIIIILKRAYNLYIISFVQDGLWIEKTSA
jgi:hypothetical protein